MATKRKIWRSGNETILCIEGATYAAELPGVECPNPKAPEKKRRYIKVFKNKPIYLPHEYERAYAEVLKGPDVVVLAANGYSSISDKNLREWRIPKFKYEHGCEGIFRSVYNAIKLSLPAADVRFAHGASNMGVDRALINVAREFKARQLGHNCPEWMFYVEDDEIPCHVGHDQSDYAERFVDSLDILIACNGREQAFKHDLMAAFFKLKHVIPINVLKAIADGNGPPALDENGKIQDAVAAYEHHVHLVGQQLSGNHPDKFLELVHHVCQHTTAIARNKISSQHGFSQAPIALAKVFAY